MNVLDFPRQLLVVVLRLFWKIESLHTLECPSYIMLYLAILAASVMILMFDLLPKQPWVGNAGHSLPLSLSPDSKEVEGCYRSSSTKKTAPLLAAAEQGHVEAVSSTLKLPCRSFNPHEFVVDLWRSLTDILKFKCPQKTMLILPIDYN